MPKELFNGYRSFDWFSFSSAHSRLLQLLGLGIFGLYDPRLLALFNRRSVFACRTALRGPTTGVYIFSKR